MTGLIVFGALALPIIFWIIWLHNKEVKLKNIVKAQQKVCSAYFDKAWKVIKQGAETSDEYRKLFEKTYPELVTGRYKGDGKDLMAKVVKEDNPDILTELYERLMRVIENERYGFFKQQEKLIEFDLEHKNLCMVFPNNIIIGGRAPIGIKVIESPEEYNSQLDLDINLFKNGK